MSARQSKKVSLSHLKYRSLIFWSKIGRHSRIVKEKPMENNAVTSERENACITVVLCTVVRIQDRNRAPDTVEKFVGDVARP